MAQQHMIKCVRPRMRMNTASVCIVKWSGLPQKMFGYFAMLLRPLGWLKHMNGTSPTLHSVVNESWRKLPVTPSVLWNFHARFLFRKQWNCDRYPKHGQLKVMPKKKDTIVMYCCTALPSAQLNPKERKLKRKRAENLSKFRSPSGHGTKTEFKTPKFCIKFSVMSQPILAHSTKEAFNM